MTNSTQRLAELWASVKNDYPESDYEVWKDSPFRDLKFEPSSSRKGAMAKRLVEKWCADRGFEVKPADAKSFDRRIQGYRFQIKFSTEWENGFYKFQQIRNEPYDYLFCLGVAPQAAHAWVVSKESAFGNCEGQHTGAEGTETRWFQCDPTTPPEWLLGCGGSLDEAAAAVKALGKK